MTETSKKLVWGARIGWLVLVLVFLVFVWGMNRRGRLEATGANVIRMLFVPSVEQGTLVERGDELARFIRRDSGLILRSEVPTSYAAVIQALGSGQADVAWMPAFAYVIAHARYGVEAKLQVVRSLERFAIVVTRDAEGEPSDLSDLAGKRVAFPRALHAELAARMRSTLTEEAPGWVEVAVEDDPDSVQQLVSSPPVVDAAVSGFVYSGPFDFVGDGRKELEYRRPGTLEQTRIIFTTDDPVSENVRVYHGCVYARTDSGVRQLQDLTGQSFAFSDETSTSGHIFPRLLLERDGVSLGRVYYAGGHPNVVQAVWDGKALGGSAFYSPPSPQQRAEGLNVGDARYLLIKRMAEAERREAFLEEVRVLRKTDPIPNDLCAIRRGFPEQVWDRFAASLARYLDTEEGKETLFDLLAGVAADPTDDSAFDGFRGALAVSGISADTLLAAEEEKLEKREESAGGDS